MVFRNPRAVAAYRALYSNQRLLPVKLLAWSAICIILTLRTGRLFLREGAAATVAYAVLAHAFGWFLTAVLAALLVVLALMAYLSGQPDRNEGHRAGAEGFAGQACENTVEALEHLLQRDRGPDGPLQHFPYVEVDLQETRDGEVLLLHDDHLGHAFPYTGPNVTAWDELRSASGLDHSTARVRDVTAQQLRALCLGGREGVHAPTLAEFLAACRRLELGRPLVLEVKSLVSHGGRVKFVQAVREYAQFAQQQRAKQPQHEHLPFGFFGIIAFPHLYAASLGEFGTAEWRHWAQQLAAAGVPTRSCCFHALSLIYGANR